MKMTTVTQGAIGVGKAISYFTANGRTVSIPLNDNQPYDLVVDIDGLKRVSVKTTRYKPKGSKNYVVELKSCRHNKNENKLKKFDGEAVDFLFVCTDENLYLVPAMEVHDTTALSLGDKAEKWKLTT